MGQRPGEFYSILLQGIVLKHGGHAQANLRRPHAKPYLLKPCFVACLALVLSDSVHVHVLKSWNSHHLKAGTVAFRLGRVREPRYL